jgi:hypothetical protein
MTEKDVQDTIDGGWAQGNVVALERFADLEFSSTEGDLSFALALAHDIVGGVLDPR